MANLYELLCALVAQKRTFKRTEVSRGPYSGSQCDG